MERSEATAGEDEQRATSTSFSSGAANARSPARTPGRETRPEGDVGATARQVTRGATTGALAEPIGQPRTAGGRDADPIAELGLDARLRELALKRAVDVGAVLALIDAAPIGEVIGVACRPAVIRHVEAHLAAAADGVRARLARRVFFDGLQPVLAWSLITGNDRVRRQRYLDRFGSVAEQRAFEDAVIADGTNIGYVMRAFDSYWDVEAQRQAGGRWNIAVVQGFHLQLKQLPDGDVRAQDGRGRVWQKLVLSVDPTFINRAAFGDGAFILGANASMDGSQEMGYGTKLSADVTPGAVDLAVSEGNRLDVGDTIALGTGTQTLSVDPRYDRSTITAIAGHTVTVRAGLRYAHRAGDTVSKVDAEHGAVSLTAATVQHAHTLQVTDGAHFSVNDGFAVGAGTNATSTSAHYDHGTVSAIAGNTLTVTPALGHSHQVGDVVARTVAVGNNSALVDAVSVGESTLVVGEGKRFALNDVIALGDSAMPTSADSNFDWARIAAIDGNKLTTHQPMRHAHAAGDTVRRVDERGSGTHNARWLTATVRHEIAHAVDAANPNLVRGFTVGVGGWWTGTGADAFDKWAQTMGNAWRGATSGWPGRTTPITDADKARVKTTITDAVTRGAGSLFTMGLSASHPIMRNRGNHVPVIVAAQTCLVRGDNFYAAPEELYAVSGRVFSISNWYRAFMFHNEDVRTKRLSNYSLYAPAEYFAETYTAYYEEAGRPGVGEADYGRMVEDGVQRAWVHDNIQARGLAPRGTGEHRPDSPAMRAAPTKSNAGAEPGSGTGKKTHRAGPE